MIHVHYIICPFVAIGHPRGAPLRWMLPGLTKPSRMGRMSKMSCGCLPPAPHPLQGRPLWLSARSSDRIPSPTLHHLPLRGNRAPTRGAPAVDVRPNAVTHITSFAPSWQSGTHKGRPCGGCGHPQGAPLRWMLPGLTKPSKPNQDHTPPMSGLKCPCIPSLSRKATIGYLI